jgi:dipicolinate synthase subunit A
LVTALTLTHSYAYYITVSAYIRKQFPYWKYTKGMMKMRRDIKIAFVGGDMRQIYCAKKIAAEGFETALYGFGKEACDIGLCTKCVELSDVLEKADAVVFPLPVSNDSVFINTPLSDKAIKLDDAIAASYGAKLILYGGSCLKIEQHCKKYGIAGIDYSKREDFQILNAEPTAEGALAIAINEMKKTLWGSTVLVIGYGRIGKVLSRYLCALGAKVYSSARNPGDLAYIKLSESTAIHTSDISRILPECDMILNTVPKTILKDELLDLIPKDALIIDLASKPGGIDFKPAKEKGLNVIWALSLPGKTAPISAGEILADTITEIINEAGLGAERKCIT